MTKDLPNSHQALIKRLAEEVSARQDLQAELLNALRSQKALEKEIALLREVLNARSAVDFVAYKSLRRARSLVKRGPKSIAQTAVRRARRRAGAAKRKVLSLRQNESFPPNP